MGGPGGVTGQPSTWLTQLVERPLRRTEGPGVGVNKHSQPAATQTHGTGVRTLASFTHTHTHTPRPCPDLWHQRCQDTRLHVGSNQRRCQSTASTPRRSAHGSPPPPPTRQKGRVCCPSSVISSSLPACHLRSLGPVSLAPYPCQQPYGYHPPTPTMSSPRLLPHSPTPPTLSSSEPR